MEQRAPAKRIQIAGPGKPNRGLTGSPEFQGLFANYRRLKPVAMWAARRKTGGGLLLQPSALSVSGRPRTIAQYRLREDYVQLIHAGLLQMQHGNPAYGAVALAHQFIHAVLYVRDPLPGNHLIFMHCDFFRSCPHYREKRWRNANGQRTG
jgi:hypothetical protein